MKAIINATIVLFDHYIRDGVLLMDGDRIADFGPAEKITVPKDAEIIDAAGKFVGPGLIDIHCHDADGTTFDVDPERACRFHLKGGTTFIMPTLYARFTTDEYINDYKIYKEARKSGAAQIIGGIYMEGPYLSAKYGSNKKAMELWGKTVCKDDYKRLVDTIGDFVRVWALSPERENAEEFVAYTKQQFPNAIFTVAHSEASPEQIERLIPYGLKIGTHHTNATGDLPVYPECRGVCVDETVNYRDDIYAEVISDRMGIHVAPYMQRLIKKIKGVDKILLITDNSSTEDGPMPKAGIYDGAYDLVYDHYGEISGTKLYLSAACGNFMKHTGASICEVFRMASYNQAKLLGLSDRGEIRKGARADIVIVDCFMTPEKVFLGGEDIENIIK